MGVQLIVLLNSHSRAQAMSGLVEVSLLSLEGGQDATHASVRAKARGI